MAIPINKQQSDNARQEGNAAFKKGKWAESIGHYTNAVIHNPDDPVAYCNRAQAYLKLDKYLDAERDCTTALERQKGNIKALYRRALARRGLDKLSEAAEDLTTLLEHDPDNSTAKDELQEVKDELKRRPTGFAAMRKERDSKKAYVAPVSNKDHPQPASDINPAISATPVVPAAPSAPPLPTVPAIPATPLTPPTPPCDPHSTAPGTGLLLVRALKPLSPARAWCLLEQYPPANIPLILGPILEPDTLGILLIAISHAPLDAARPIMIGLCTSPRIKINVAMLDPKHANIAQEIWKQCNQAGSWP